MLSMNRNPSLIVIPLVVSPATAVSFAPPVMIDTPGATADIVLVDLDDDNDLDIASLEVQFNFAVGQALGMINVALNDGGGNFSDAQTFELGTFGALEFALQRLVAADADGDGDPDLAAIGTTAPLHVLFNDGAGGFDSFINTGISVSFGPLNSVLDAGDLDGDDDIDFAIGLPGQTVFNRGPDSFEPTIFSQDANMQNLEIVDLDGDRDMDIAYGFRVHVNNGRGGVSPLPGTYPGGGARECVFADFDGDDDADVACAQNSPGGLRTALNNGDATFGPTVDIPTIAPIDLHAGHFNADAHLDLLLTHTIGNEVISINPGLGDGSFDEAIILPSPNGTIAAPGDLNGDGFDDVVMSTGFVLSTTPTPLAVLLNNGPGPDEPGDLNGDGVVDGLDLGILLAQWMQPESPADLNGDGTVDGLDLGILLASWTL